MSCKTCQILVEEIAYLRKLVDSLLVKNSVEPVQPAALNKFRDALDDHNYEMPTASEAM